MSPASSTTRVHTKQGLCLTPINLQIHFSRTALPWHLAVQVSALIGQGTIPSLIQVIHSKQDPAMGLEEVKDKPRCCHFVTSRAENNKHCDHLQWWVRWGLGAHHGCEPSETPFLHKLLKPSLQVCEVSLQSLQRSHPSLHGCWCSPAQGQAPPLPATNLTGDRYRLRERAAETYPLIEEEPDQGGECLHTAP